VAGVLENNIMKVFCDLHHEDLFYSLQLLFEKRMGAEVYRPIGLEWYEQKYWAIYPHISTAKQYLDMSSIPPVNVHGVPVTEEHGDGAWINKGNFASSDGIFIVPDKQHLNGIPHRAITLERFKETKFDVLLCSIPTHLPIWKELKRLYQPQAKVVFQAGNDWGYIDCKNLLTSSRKTTNRGHEVYYHQEFDTSVFKPGDVKNKTSIVNLQHLTQSKEQLLQLESLLPGWDVKIYGAGNRDGSRESKLLPSTLQEAGFLWHVKKGGDGYGYNIHQAIASGTPLIVNSQYTNGTTAEYLCKWGSTAIDINGKSLDAVKNELIGMVDKYDEISANTAKHFTEVVSFENEYQQVRHFIENLIE
jgi:hypothetical protein